MWKCHVRGPCCQSWICTVGPDIYLSSHLQIFPFPMIPQCPKWSWAHICMQTTWLLWKKLVMCWPKETYGGRWQRASSKHICGLWKSLPKVTSIFHGKALVLQQGQQSWTWNFAEILPSQSKLCKRNSGSSSHLSGDSWQVALVLTVVSSLFCCCWLHFY